MENVCDELHVEETTSGLWQIVWRLLEHFLQSNEICEMIELRVAEDCFVDEKVLLLMRWDRQVQVVEIVVDDFEDSGGKVTKGNVRVVDDAVNLEHSENGKRKLKH